MLPCVVLYCTVLYCTCTVLYLYCLQDIPSIIASAETERAQRVQLQAKMREAQGADKGVVLYLQVRLKHTPGARGRGYRQRGKVGQHSTAVASKWEAQGQDKGLVLYLHVSAHRAGEEGVLWKRRLKSGGEAVCGA